MADLSRATDSARLVLRWARRYARSPGRGLAPSIAVLHATLDVPWCVAAQALTALGVGPEAISSQTRAAATTTDPEGFDAPSAGAAEATRRESPYLGTEHLLMGLVRDPNTGAARVLSACGVTADQVDAAVAACQSGPRPPLMWRARAARIWRDLRWLAGAATDPTPRSPG